MNLSKKIGFFLLLVSGFTMYGSSSLTSKNRESSIIVGTFVRTQDNNKLEFIKLKSKFIVIYLDQASVKKSSNLNGSGSKK